MDFGPLVPANNPVVRELQPSQNSDLGRAAGPRLYPDLPSSQESPVGESIRILRKRIWIIVGCLATIFSVVAIASLKMPKVYEAGGTIEINKPDANLNFQNSTTFSLDYFDPTELETELKILQSDVLALHVIRELNLDRNSDLANQAPPSPNGDLAPDPMQADPALAAGMVGSFKANLRVALLPNTRIIEVHYRGADPDRAAAVVNTLMQTYVDENRKSRYDATMDSSKWLAGQLVDMQMKVESSQEELVRYQKEHEILGIDEKQNITMAKLDELNKQLTSAESERMDKEALYRLVETGDPDDDRLGYRRPR